jgi:hypothetical protein
MMSPLCHRDQCLIFRGSFAFREPFFLLGNYLTLHPQGDAIPLLNCTVEIDIFIPDGVCSFQKPFLSRGNYLTLLHPNRDVYSKVLSHQFLLV